LFRTRSAALFGIDAHLIDDEVDMYPGIQRDIVALGQPDSAVKESREAHKISADQFRLSVPIEERDHQSRAREYTQRRRGIRSAVATAEHHLFVGELSLDGSVRPVRGAPSIAPARAKKGIKI
jgi:magnesium chelatase family protein